MSAAVRDAVLAEGQAVSTASSLVPEAEEPGRRRRRTLLRGRGLVGLVLLAVLVLAGLLAPLLAPYPPNEQIPGANLLRPSAAHLFGTDHVNRDVFSRTLYGIRTDLVIVFVAVPIGALLGTLRRCSARWSGPWTSPCNARSMSCWRSPR